MNFNLDALIRPSVKNLIPFSPARGEHDPSKEVADILLDANESPYETGLNRYPDPLQRDVKRALAFIKGVTPDQIFLGNGSDEIIDLLVRAFGVPGQDNIIILPPTFSMYQVAARANDLEVKEILLDGAFQMDAEAVLGAITPNTKMVCLCTPNNPTGNLMNPEAVMQVLKQASCLVVLDEAYIDFAPDQSLLPRLGEFPNLIILQTFSKAWGMAGVRLGAAYASAEIIKVLNRLKPPYNINILTQQAALKALADPGAVTIRVAEQLREKDHLATALASIPHVLKVHPSDANFLLVQFPDAAAMLAHLKQQHVIVRDRSREPGCAGCLRISVGTPDENRALLAAVAAWVPTAVHA